MEANMSTCDLCPNLGVLDPWLKINMFCVQFQNYQQLFQKKKKKKNDSCILNKLSNELKNDIEIVLYQNS